jgi:hypothetical protein
VQAYTRFLWDWGVGRKVRLGIAILSSEVKASGLLFMTKPAQRPVTFEAASAAAQSDRNDMVGIPQANPSPFDPG